MKGKKEKKKQAQVLGTHQQEKTQPRNRQCSREQGQLHQVLLKHDKGGQ